MAKEKPNFICYTLTIDKHRRYELETFFNETFYDINYEIISDIEEQELETEFGEIYDDAITEYTNFSIRFYVEPKMQSATTKRLKKLPNGTFIEKNMIYFSEDDALEAYKQSFMLTDSCQIIFDATELDKKKKHIVQIILPPRNAFGTGTHTTTKLAAKLLEKYPMTKKVIDVGTGSGILAVYAAKLGAEAVLAVDSDEIAITEAKTVIGENKCKSTITLKQNNFLDGIAIKQYTDIIANLSIDLYTEFLPSLKKVALKKHNFLFSGIQKKQRKQFEEELEKNSFSIVDSINENDWIAYYVRKK